MSDDLYIDVVAFEQLTTTLETAAEDMATATRQLVDAAVEGMGIRALDVAAGSFNNEWGYGVKKIGEATEGLVTVMRATKDAYVLQDDATSQSFDTCGAALAEAGPLPGGSTTAPGVDGVSPPARTGHSLAGL
ncbi:hypothetical protein G4H71_15260 [Rhodococcus triatomae]|uniref:Excreted virulence factor EspC, type VII ESX diderm n=1 Tax=Rhodococcus triatomae TaxID=300028 RepID=A0A1G8RS78_9NOCA|nr:hypothetical protein [Rhodococcus triatomae]QNG19875.1 hypothetical protein G4H72_15110 [Rhodococcus triatomae]QNG24209.1 hypothetical protein G4H71_15260 [Rhodococcus triatomae]SDJ19230.1 hypothetical protein SAMN05444695_11873 [Rhodococcus triatomae]